MGKARGGKWRDSDFLRWELEPCFLSPAAELLDERLLPLKPSKGLKHLAAGKRSERRLQAKGYASQQPNATNPGLWDRHRRFPSPIVDDLLCSQELDDQLTSNLCPARRPGSSTGHTHFCQADWDPPAFMPTAWSKQSSWAEHDNHGKNNHNNDDLYCLSRLHLVATMHLFRQWESQNWTQGTSDHLPDGQIADFGTWLSPRSPNPTESPGTWRAACEAHSPKPCSCWI